MATNSDPGSLKRGYRKKNSMIDDEQTQARVRRVIECSMAVAAMKPLDLMTCSFEDLQEQFKAYMEIHHEYGLLPDVDSFAYIYGTNRQRMNEITSNNPNLNTARHHYAEKLPPRTREFLKSAKLIIATQRSKATDAGAIPMVWSIFEKKNNEGWVDQKETVHAVALPGAATEVQEISERYLEEDKTE